MRLPLFSLRRFRRNYELIPITTLIVADLVGGTAYGLYMLWTKPDVDVIKSRDERFKRLNIEEPQTLRLFQGEFKNTYPKEMDDLRREIWSAK